MNRQPSARTTIEGPEVNKKHMSDYYKVFDDDEWSLLGSRFARSVAKNKARKASAARFDEGWMDQATKQRRPKPYRDRSY